MTQSMQSAPKSPNGRSRTLLSIQTGSRPMKAALDHPKPKPSRPHGFKSAFSDLFSKTGRDSRAQSPDFVVLSHTQTTVSDAPKVEPVEPKEYIVMGTEPEKYYPSADEEYVCDTPTEAVTPVLTIAPDTLSRSYKKLLSKQYSYSSLYSKKTHKTTRQRRYRQPDLDTFSYTNPSFRLNSNHTDAEEYLTNYRAESGDTTNGETLSEFTSDSAFDFDNSSQLSDESSHPTIHNISMLPIVAPDLSICADRAAPPSVDKRRPSTGHIQLLATYADIMSEIDDLVPEDALSPSAMAESAILMKAERSMSASAVHMEGLLGRLKSPSVSPVPGSGAVTPKRRLTPMQSELSILAAYGDQASADTMLKDGIEAWDAEEEEIDDESDEEVEFVIEEYFVKHRAPTLIAGEGEMSSGSDSEEENDERNGTPKPRRLDSSASKFTIGVYANDAAAGDADTIADSIKTTDPMPGDADTVVSAVGHDPALSIARTDIAPNSEFLVPSPATPLEEYSDTNDDDEERAIVPSHMIVSKVTRVVTVNKDNVVRGVQVHVEPLGTVASSGNIPAAHRLRHTLSALNLKDGSAPNAAVSSSPASPKPASPSPVSASEGSKSPMLVGGRMGTGVQRRLKTEDGGSKPVSKRRSGLSTFLHFLANN